METLQPEIGERLARREPGALEDAYAEYGPRVLAYLTRVVGASEAEDVLQRTFLDAWRFAPQQDPGRRFVGWLYAIARHRALDALRARRRGWAPEGPRADDLADSLVGDGRETADRLALAADLRAAVALLPAHERRAVELTYFGDLSHREVAALLGVPVGTVKARVSRGTRRLRYHVR